MEQSSLEKLVEQVEQIAREDGERIRAMIRPEIFTKEGHANFVTSADLASQEFLMEKLSQILPEAGFLAEEGEGKKLPEGLCFIIDPIDGTANFMRGCNRSAISIGLVCQGEGLLGVVLNFDSGELFSAVKGGGAFLNGSPIHAAEVPLSQSLLVFGSSPYYRDLLEPTFSVVKKVFLQCGDIRRSGSAALDLCDVAAGRYDAFFEAKLSPWDYAASSVIIREAGGQIISGRMGLSYDKPCPICAGNGPLFQAVLAAAESEGIF